jgi:hypothetical protein
MFAGRKNLFIAGAGYDQSNLRFQQSGQYGYINADRSVTPVDAWADGSQSAGVGETALDSRVSLSGRTRTWSLFATDTLSITDRWHATLSGRYNRSTVKPRQAQSRRGADSLDGNHLQPLQSGLRPHLYAVPRLERLRRLQRRQPHADAIELGCANRTTLQAAQRHGRRSAAQAGGDQDLGLGLRGQASGATRWNLGLFRAENHDDILFVADDQLGYGYFKNFGKTRRQGVEAGASTAIGRSAWPQLHLHRRHLSFGRGASAAPATAPTAPAPASKAASRSAPATAFR